jgi:hypothetical protein
VIFLVKAADSEFPRLGRDVVPRDAGMVAEGKVR